MTTITAVSGLFVSHERQIADWYPDMCSLGPASEQRGIECTAMPIKSEPWDCYNEG
jgi:hypothetical protein